MGTAVLLRTTGVLGTWTQSAGPPKAALHRDPEGPCRKGKRPSFSEAAPPEKARTLYELLAAKCRERGITVETGVFREMMKVYSVNDGPVTLLLDSRRFF